VGALLAAWGSKVSASVALAQRSTFSAEAAPPNASATRIVIPANNGLELLIVRASLTFGAQ
jgi:hypothetical protein